MRSSKHRRLAAALVAMLILQLIPGTVLSALADGVVSFVGALKPRAAYYTVDFANHDNNVIATQFVSQGGAAIAPENPSREATGAEGNVAWTFREWQSNPAGISLNNITQDVVFLAVYDKLEMVPFTINYVLQAPDPTAKLPPTAIHYYPAGDTASISIPSPMVSGYRPDTDTVTYGGVMGQDPAAETVTVTYIKQPALSYTVKHWFETDDAVANNQEPVPGNASHFTVDNSLDDSGTVEYGDAAVLTDRAKPGYTMITQVQEPATTDNKEYNVYYKKNRYTLTYDSNGTGASVPTPATIKYNNLITLPTNPTRQGYSFAGWFQNADGTGTQYSAASRMPASDLTIFGKWNGNAVGYKIVHWVEKPNFSGTPTMGNMSDYIYHSEKIMTGGTAGATVPQGVIDANLQSILVPNVTTRVYAEYQGYDSTTKLEGDGTTVINIYYKRYLFQYNFIPTPASTPARVGTFPGMAAGQVKTLFFKFEQDLLNGPDRWPYPESGYEPTYTDNYKLQQWNFPVSYPINRRDILTADMVPANPTTAQAVAPSSVVLSTSARTYDLWYFEKLLGQTIVPHVYNATGARTASGIVTIPDGIPGYSRDILGSTGHGSSLNTQGCTFIGCNHSVNTNKHTSSFSGNKISIYEVYMKRNRVAITFDKNTSGSVTAPPKATNVMYGETYPYWPAATVNALANWKSGVSPTYVDASGVTWVFENWHLYPEVDSVVTLNSTTTAPAQSVVYYAHWKAQEVKVTLRVDGTVTKVETLPAYSPLSDALPMADPSKAGYTFTGWYKDGVRYGGDFLLRSDIVLDAVFTPNSTAYTVRCVDEGGADIQQPRRVTGMVVDNTIRIPQDEAASTIAGYTLVDTTPSSGILTLVENENDNVITFKYKKFDGYKYNIRYVLESNPSVDVFPPALNQNTWAERQVVWAKKDPTLAHYPVDGIGNTQEYQVATMDPNNVTEIVFTYRGYAVINYTEECILADGPNAGQVFHTAQKQAKIGQTVTHGETHTTYTHSGKGYTYDASVAGTLNSKTVVTANDVIVLKRYYSIDRDIKFVAGVNGALTGTLTFTVPKHSPWSSVTVPTPVPDTNYYFSGWTPSSFPAVITADATFTANFTLKQNITVRSKSLSTTYNASLQSVSGFEVLNAGGGVITNLTVTGITTSDPSETNAGTYPNTIGNRNALVIHQGTEDVTHKYIVAFEEGKLDIAKKAISVKPTDVSSPYTGLLQEPKGITTSGELPGHKVVAAVIGGGTIVATYPLTVQGAVQILDAGDNDVTSNYQIQVNPGSLTITSLTGNNRIPLYIQPDDVTVTFTGQEITESTTTGTVLINSLTPPLGTQVTFKAQGKATIVGTHPVLNVITSGADAWKVMVDTQDMSANYVLLPILSGNLIIEAAQGVIPFSITPHPVTREYTGALQTETVTDGTIVIDGTTYPNKAAALADGFDVRFTATGSGTVPGVYQTVINSASVEVWVGGFDATSNYNRTLNDGTFTITDIDTSTGGTKIPVAIMNKGDTRPYTGHEQSVTYTNDAQLITVNGTEISVLNAQNGNVLTVEFVATGKGTVPNGTGYDVEIANLSQVIVRLNGTDVTKNYDVSQTAGKLIITELTNPTQKLQLTIRPDDVQKDFNGTVQSSGNVTTGTLMINGIPLATFNKAGDPPVQVSFGAEGTGFAPGTYDILVTNGSITIMQDSKDVSVNYQVVNQKGIFTINALPAGNRIPLHITPNHDTREYTGVMQTTTVTQGTILHDGVDITTTPVDVSITFTATGQGLEPKPDHPITVQRAKVMAGTKDVTDQYDITYGVGKFAITQRAPGNEIALHIKPDNVDKVFNSQDQWAYVTTGTVQHGSPHVAPDANVQITFQASGVGKLIGAYDIKIDSTLPGHSGDFFKVMANGEDVTASYKLVQTPGVLTIKAATGSSRQQIVITPKDVRLPFNGQVQTVNQTQADGQIELRTPQGAPISPLPTGLVIQYTASGKGFMPKDDYDIAVDPSTITVTLDGQDVKANYDIKTVKGKLGIWELTDNPGGPGPGPGGEDKRKITLEITPAQYTALYSGQVITVPVNHGGTVLHGGSPIAGYPLTVTFQLTGSGVAPGNHATSVVEPTVVVKTKATDGFGIVDVTSNYALDLKPGVLEIQPRGAGNKIPLFIQPSNVTYDYNAAEQTANVTTGTVKIGGNAASQYPNLTVSFAAQGKATNVGTYPVIVVVNTSVTVMAGTVDVTSQYDLTTAPGTLVIRTAGFPITVTAENVSYVFDGTAQGKTSYVGTAAPSSSMPQTGTLQIIINRPVTRQNVGITPIQFAPGDVTILHDGTDITTNYHISPIAGNLEITKKPLAGTLTAVRPGASYVYGDPIPAATAIWNLGAGNDYVPGFEPVYTITTVSGDEPKNVGSYVFRPVLGATGAINENYDLTGVTLVDSASMDITRAMLTVTPVEVWHAQRYAIQQNEFRYVIDGYKYKDRQGTAGPNDIQYEAIGANPTATIGTTYDITKQTGSVQIQNYDVTYNSLLGGFHMYGQVWYHGNYLDGTSKVSHLGKYVQPTDVVTPAADAGKAGLYRPDMRFVEWTLDPAGTVPYTGGPIGLNTIDVYAQWEQLYQMDIHYVDEDGDEIVDTETLWLAEDQIFELLAKDIKGYEPDFVAWILGANGFEQREFITTKKGPKVTMPKDIVDVTIYYRTLPGAGFAPVPTATPKPIEELEGEGVAFSILKEDMPLPGIMPQNVGVCIE